MESSKLEQLEQGLRHALQLVERDESGARGDIERTHPAARAAEDCELMLPEQLTLASLGEAIRHKIETIHVLLDRARAHEQLPADAQLAADEGYMVETDELADARDAGKPPHQ